VPKIFHLTGDSTKRELISQKSVRYSPSFSHRNASHGFPMQNILDMQKESPYILIYRTQYLIKKR
jgi:hypothetical protein